MFASRERSAVLSLFVMLGVAMADDGGQLKLKEIYQEQFTPPGKWIGAQFASLDGRFLLIAEPLSEASDVVATDWELRVVDTVERRTIAARTLSYMTDMGCDGLGLDIVGFAGEEEIVVQWCGKTEFMDRSVLKTRFVIPEMVGLVSPRGTWALSQHDWFSVSSTRGRPLHQIHPWAPHCSIEVEESQAGEEVIWEKATFSADDAYLALMASYGPLSPKDGFIRRRRSLLRVYDVSACRVAGEVWFDLGKEPGPPTELFFVGEGQRWIVTSNVSWDGVAFIDVFDWQSGRRIKTIKYASGLSSIEDVSYDGRWAVVSSPDDPARQRAIREFAIVDLETGKLAYKSPEISSSLWLSKYGKFSVGQLGGPKHFAAGAPMLLTVSMDTISVYVVEKPNTSQTRQDDQQD